MVVKYIRTLKAAEIKSKINYDRIRDFQRRGNWELKMLDICYLLSFLILKKGEHIKREYIKALVSVRGFSFHAHLFDEIDNTTGFVRIDLEDRLLEWNCRFSLKINDNVLNKYNCEMKYSQK